MSEYPIVYKCDPSKYKECKKTMCQKPCRYTTFSKYSIDGKRYKYNADTDRFEVVDAGQ